MLGPFVKAQLRTCTYRSRYPNSFKTKISNIIQGILNKMANEDYRTFDKGPDSNLPAQPPKPQN